MIEPPSPQHSLIVTTETGRTGFTASSIAGFALILTLVFGAQTWWSWISDAQVRAIAAHVSTALILVALVVYGERKPVTSLGFTTLGWRDFGVALGIALAACAAMAAAVYGIVLFDLHAPMVLKPALPDRGMWPWFSWDGTGGGAYPESVLLGAGTQIYNALAPVGLIALACDELTFRGYAIERFRRWTGKLGLGALLSWLVFFVLPIPLVCIGMAAPEVRAMTAGVAIEGAVMALVFTIAYVSTRNLGQVMIARVLCAIALTAYFAHGR